MIDRSSTRVVLCVVLLLGASLACQKPAPPAPQLPAVAQNVLLITIDTLRADAIGAYGGTASTPTLDALASQGARVDRAWTTAPITLTAHASILTGLYPPGHAARHNGIAATATVPTLAESLKAAGFSTAAFVSAFPLDRRFGLTRGFDVYDDELPRDGSGRPLNERAGADTVTRAAAWLARHRQGRFFLWVHLFEPHAPYGRAGDRGTARERYASDVTIADREAGRLITALAEAAPSTLVVAAADHGEAFGEHEEIGHSIFIYDTTLRVPLLMRGPGVPAGVVVSGEASLVDVAPTIAALTGTPPLKADGLSLTAAFAGTPIAPRPIYAESFAPLYDFGWAGLRAVRNGAWKYISAPTPELYDTTADPHEQSNRAEAEPGRLTEAERQVTAWSPAEPTIAAGQSATSTMSPEVAARLRSLGYASGGSTRPRPGAPRPDPKDRIAVASQMALVTSGEVAGEEMVRTLQAILRSDPQNPQAHLRLGYAEIDRGRCDRAEPHLRSALQARVPSADAGLGLAGCLLARSDRAGAGAALGEARRAEPGNPVVAANLGLLAMQTRDFATAISELRAALLADPLMLEVRFALARALASSGDRPGALAEATTLLAQLPSGAPQRAEVERLINALR